MQPAGGPAYCAVRSKSFPLPAARQVSRQGRPIGNLSQSFEPARKIIDNGKHRPVAVASALSWNVGSC